MTRQTSSAFRSGLLLPLLVNLPTTDLITDLTAPTAPPSGAPRVAAGSNLLHVRDHNQLLVLHAIRTGLASTRRGLAEITGLTFQTVENISRRLIDAGIVTDDDSVGTRSRQLVFRPRGAHAIGIEVGVDVVRVALCTADGRRVGSEQMPIGPGHEPARVADWLSHAVPDLIDLGGAPVTTVVGAGVVSTDASESGVDRHLPAGFAQALQRRIGMPVIETTGPVVALRQQLWSGSLTETDCLYVHLDSDLHCMIVSGGRVLPAGHGRSETREHFAHLTVATGGVRCVCGRRGCLRTIVSEGALRTAVADRLHLTDKPSLAAAMELARSVPQAGAVVTRAAHQLARALLPAVQLLDPGSVVLGGSVSDAFGDVLGRVVSRKLRDRLGALAPPVKRATTGPGPAVAAASVILHRVFTPAGDRPFQRGG